MDVTCISDLHGHLPELPGGDLLIVAGDLTARDKTDEYLEFYAWLDEQNYKCKIVVAGNHDNALAKPEYMGRSDRFHPAIYLCDSGTEFEGLKIWGSPWTKTFEGMNPHCMAFTCETEEELDSKFAKIPEGLNILITHSPVRGFVDKLSNGENAGSFALKKALWKMFEPPQFIICGHIHEAY
ncbi:MAG TPA: metallophosphoesterase, partial [Rhabdochlamydiaceae bacterium]